MSSLASHEKQLHLYTAVLIVKSSKMAVDDSDVPYGSECEMMMWPVLCERECLCLHACEFCPCHGCCWQSLSLSCRMSVPPPPLPPHLLSIQEIAEGDQVGVRTAREASHSSCFSLSLSLSLSLFYLSAWLRLPWLFYPPITESKQPKPTK